MWSSLLNLYNCKAVFLIKNLIVNRIPTKILGEICVYIYIYIYIYSTIKWRLKLG